VIVRGHEGLVVRFLADDDQIRPKSV